jgi:hypothetical protein
LQRIVLLGQSHAVALLDALGEWRDAVGLRGAGAGADADYSPAFHGWTSIDTGVRLFRPRVRAEYAELAGLEVCLLSAATFAGELATVASVDGGRVRLAASDALASFIRQVGDCDAIVSVISGNRHSKLALVANFPPYDFAPYDAPPVGQPIDRLHIEPYLAQLGTMVAAPLACLRSAFPHARILHVGPPPPLRTPEHARVHEALGEDLRKFGFAHPVLRRKWHEAYVAQLRTQLAPLGVPVIEADAGAVAEDGFLSPNLAEGLTHGNAAYGAHVLRALIEALPARQAGNGQRSTSAAPHSIH